MAKRLIGLSIGVDITALNAMTKLLEGQGLYSPAWNAGMDDLRRVAVVSAKAAAPVDTGRLQQSIVGTMARGPFVKWVRIRVRARAARPASTRQMTTRGRHRGWQATYPRLLEYSGKHGHKGWFSNAVNRAWANADRILNKIASNIAKKWGTK